MREKHKRQLSSAATINQPAPFSPPISLHCIQLLFFAKAIPSCLVSSFVFIKTSGRSKPCPLTPQPTTSMPSTIGQSRSNLCTGAGVVLLHVTAEKKDGSSTNPSLALQIGCNIINERLVNTQGVLMTFRAN